MFQYPLNFLSLQCMTFFWWFANAALDDEFEWQPWHWLPFGAISALFMVDYLVPQLTAAIHTASQLVMMGLALHVLWIALAERRNDLLEQRRQVRLLLVVVIGVTALSVTILELVMGNQPMPQWLATLQAFEIFIVSMVFAAFLLQPAAPLIEAQIHARSRSTPDTTPADVYELQKLEELMRTGFYTRDSLTISELAEAVAIPEHRLRRLINQQMGFRNFTSYLNNHRLSDARSMLADPTQARRQITQIAFELGYGSITPFNRAFKAEEGMTPTEFRRMALAHNTQERQVTH
jgi:AraC-like DNA-binding protein